MFGKSWMPRQIDPEGNGAAAVAQTRRRTPYHGTCAYAQYDPTCMPLITIDCVLESLPPREPPGTPPTHLAGAYHHIMRRHFV